MTMAEKLAKLPNDGKHFTCEELMTEKLTQTPFSNIYNHNTSIIKNLHIHTGSFRLRRTNSYNMEDEYEVLQGSLTTSEIGSSEHGPYTLDPDLIEDIEDVKMALKSLNKKLLTFSSREAVRGIEHLVVKNF